MTEMVQKGSAGGSELEKPKARHHDPLAQKLGSLHATLRKIDEAINRGAVEIPYLHDLVTIADELAGFVDKVAPEVRVRLKETIAWARALPGEIEAVLAKVGPSEEIPSKLLFGELPIARTVPQDIHSVVDYLNAGAALSTSLMADSTSGKIAGAALGAAGAGVSLMTDYRLGAAKIIPIEAHEVIDHVWGVSAIAAPFVLGYYKKDPAVAAMHVMLGATTIILSLFTDYRAAVGVGRRAEG